MILRFLLQNLFPVLLIYPCFLHNLYSPKLSKNSLYSPFFLLRQAHSTSCSLFLLCLDNHLGNFFQNRFDTDFPNIPLPTFDLAQDIPAIWYHRILFPHHTYPLSYRYFQQRPEHMERVPSSRLRTLRKIDRPHISSCPDQILSYLSVYKAIYHVLLHLQHLYSVYHWLPQAEYPVLFQSLPRPDLHTFAPEFHGFEAPNKKNPRQTTPYIFVQPFLHHPLFLLI